MVLMSSASVRRRSLAVLVVMSLCSLRAILLPCSAAHADWKVTYSCSANSTPSNPNTGPVTIVGPTVTWYQDYDGIGPYSGGGVSGDPPRGGGTGPGGGGGPDSFDNRSTTDSAGSVGQGGPTPNGASNNQHYGSVTCDGQITATITWDGGPQQRPASNCGPP